MGSKHLRELLREEQEPFVLQNYIQEKRLQIKPIKTRKPISHYSNFPLSFCKNACFFSSSPTKSPLFFSPLKSPSPCTTNSTLFVQIPAAVVEAAIRIQNQSVSHKSRFGMFGSILKKMVSRRRSLKQDKEIKVCVKDMMRWDSSNFNKQEIVLDLEEKGVCEIGFSSSCNSRRTSVWSESNEDKSLDLETSTSRSEDSEQEMEFLQNPCEKAFCSTPFRLVLQNQEFNTPISSPSRVKQKNFNQVVGIEEVGSISEQKEQDDEKEQNSPVSVLDPPFEDDDEEDQEEAMEIRQNAFELECSFAAVHRTKQQLLHKLQRFERLAELDPVELENRITKQENGQDQDNIVVEEEYNDDDGSDLADSEETNMFVKEVRGQSDLYKHHETISSDMKKLILDLVAEERGQATELYECELVAKVSKRFESWNEVDSNTIDMMVELDFKRDTEEWRSNPKQMQETVCAIELNIFGVLVEELSDELATSRGL